jgi:hypothetical protein
MSSSGPGFPNDSTLPLLAALVLALAFLGAVVAIGLSDGADGSPVSAKTSTESLADTTVDETPHVTLVLDTAGEGKGTVRVAGEGRVCSGECRYRLDRDTSVTIIASPARGSTFVSWTGTCGGGRICTVLLDHSHTATALFSRKEQPVDPTAPTAAECSDGVDNDADGFIDGDDDDCLLGDSEFPTDPTPPPPPPPPVAPVQPAPVVPAPVVPPPVVPPPVVVPPPPPPVIPR